MILVSKGDELGYFVAGTLGGRDRALLRSKRRAMAAIATSGIATNVRIPPGKLPPAAATATVVVF